METADILYVSGLSRIQAFDIGQRKLRCEYDAARNGLSVCSVERTLSGESGYICRTEVGGPPYDLEA